MDGLAKALVDGNTQTVVELFNTAFACIDYLRSPVQDEAACRSHIQVLLIGACLLPSVEVHGALGRSDLEVTVGQTHWVFEFKFLAKDAADADARRLLTEAKSQMKEKGYLSHALESGRTIGVALVFSEAKRQIVVSEVL